MTAVLLFVGLHLWYASSLFFFKQKTAYEMRISDWSSDVCSSDLDSIAYAWEFITSADWLGIDKNRLLVTVYHNDDEAYGIWHEQVGVPADRIVRNGDSPGTDRKSTRLNSSH